MKFSIFLIINFFIFTHAVAMKVKELDVEVQDWNKVWYQKAKTDSQNIDFLLSILRQSKSGQKVIEVASKKASDYGKLIGDILYIGEGSLTDTTLVRKFSADDPTKVLYETKSKVIINRNLSLRDAVLDLAHELTHFTYREAFNPYHAGFGLKDFIISTVEGKGGEVDAYLVECQVYFDLFGKTQQGQSNCFRVIDEKSGRVSKEKGVKEFYRIGDYFKNFQSDLETQKISVDQISGLSSDEAIFISSAWGVPYPVAAYREYTNIMDRVCKNDRNRIGLIKSQIERRPASEDFSKAFRTMKEDYSIRCQKFDSEI